MKLQLDNDSLTTEDIKAVLQRERDRARNDNVEIEKVQLHIDDHGLTVIDLYDSDVEFYAGKFVIVKGDPWWMYLPVSRIKFIRFFYK